MTIDFGGETGFESRGVSLAYLVYGVYHDEAGKERAVYWCGPKNRVGSGLIAPVPHTPTKREPGPPVIWESRLTRCSLDADLGPLDQHIQTVTDLNFNVDISGGPNAPVPEAGDLLRDIVYGRWQNKQVYAWLYELGTGNTQMIAKGFFDRDPTSINANVFQITVGVHPFLPTTEWPSFQMPSDNIWVQLGENPYANNNYKANVTVINPDHAGKFMGPVFGNSRIAQTHSADALDYDSITAGNNWGWREILPYGWNNAPQSGGYAFRWIFALAAFEDEVYVHEVVYEVAADGGITYQAETFDTLYQTDDLNGPVGTVVRFKIGLSGPSSNPDTLGNPFVWWMGPKSRAFARVSGRRCGRMGSVVTSEGGAIIREYSFQDYPDRSMPWEILEDIVSEPIYLQGVLDDLEPGLSTRVWGTAALSDFQGSVPSSVPDLDAWLKSCCCVPLNPTDRPITLREGFGSLAGSLLFDIVERHDPVVDEIRLYPVWRSSFSSTPSRVFKVEDMAKTDPPTVTQLSDPDGHYANSIVVVTPDKYEQPLKEDTDPDQNAGEFVVDPIVEKQFTLDFEAEQAPEAGGAKIYYEATPPHWHHLGDDGDAAASWVIGWEMAQPQRVVQATHGIRSYDLPMGGYIRYDITGVNSDVGMVRKMRFDYDLQTVQVTSYHVDHYTERHAPRRSNPADEGDTARHHPDGEPDE